MIKNQNNKQYDLEERTLKFARSVRDFTKKLPRTISNNEYVKQLIRSSSSIGANYIEANESLSKKDFRMRAMISRKEAKETRFWLQLIQSDSLDLEKESQLLLNEATELMKILGAIVTNSQ